MSTDTDFVNLTEDGGLKKRIIREGTGPSPLARSSVDVQYVGTLYPSGEKFDSSRDRPGHFTFTLGMGQVIKGWDEGVKTMKTGEIAELLCTADYAYGAQGSPPKIPGGATLKFEVELLGSTESTDTDEARLRVATKKKAEGNSAFAQGRWDEAVTAYAKGAELLSQVRGESERAERESLELSIFSNKALCHLKLRENAPAVQAANRALDINPKHPKALFRLAQALLNQGDFERAAEAADDLIRWDAGNTEAVRLHETIKAKEAAYKKAEKKVYANMFA